MEPIKPAGTRPDPSSGRRGMSTAMKVRLVVFGVLLLLVTAIFIYFQGERALAEEHNRIVEELVQAGEYRQAIEQLEPLVERAGMVVGPEMRRTLATCYARVGDEPGNSIAESAEWYRKAKTLDPDLIDAQRQQMIDAAGP